MTNSINLNNYSLTNFVSQLLHEQMFLFKKCVFKNYLIKQKKLKIFNFINNKKQNYDVKNYDENNYLLKMCNNNYIINKKNMFVVGKINEKNNLVNLTYNDINICKELNLDYFQNNF